MILANKRYQLESDASLSRNPQAAGINTTPSYAPPDPSHTYTLCANYE